MQNTENRFHLSLLACDISAEICSVYGCDKRNSVCRRVCMIYGCWLYSHPINDANYRRQKEFRLLHPWPEIIGRNLLRVMAVKTENFLSPIFLIFICAVSASVNDANYRKPNSFITPMTRDMGRNMLPAVKMENFLSPIFLIFIWL